MAEIVVGVDGSPGSDAALRWALEEARIREAGVHAMHAFEPPPLAFDVTPIGPAGTIAEVLPGELEQLTRTAEAAARAVLEAALDRAHVADSGVGVRSSLVQGHAATVLADATRDA